MFDSYELLVILLCFIASGFFSGAEAVLLSVGIDRAEQLAKEGGTRASGFQFMVDKPNEILSTILIGNNIANIYAASLTTTIAARYFKDDAIAISVGITTILILIFGEVIPKSFARAHAEFLSHGVLKILKVLYITIYPFVQIMTFIVEKVLGDSAEVHPRFVGKNDIEYMVEKAEKENSMDSKQIELLNSILEFPMIKVKDIMIPRNQVKYVNKNSNFKDVVNYIRIDSHSRYPVIDGDIEHTIGFLHVKDLAFVNRAEQESFNVEKYIKEPFFVYEHMKIQAVFDHMNRKKVHLALVKDENGLVVGIITLEDIIEEIMGEIQDEHDNEIHDEVNKNGEGILVLGIISIRDLYTEYDIHIPLNDNYSTLAGFILDMLGNTFPESGQIIVWEGIIFELEKVDEFEIRKIRIKDVDGEKHYFSKTDS